MDNLGKRKIRSPSSCSYFKTQRHYGGGWLDLLETEKLPRNYCQTVYLNIQKYRMKQNHSKFCETTIKIVNNHKTENIIRPFTWRLHLNLSDNIFHDMKRATFDEVLRIFHTSTKHFLVLHHSSSYLQNYNKLIQVYKVFPHLQPRRCLQTECLKKESGCLSFDEAELEIQLQVGHYHTVALCLKNITS